MKTFFPVVLICLSLFIYPDTQNKEKLDSINKEIVTIEKKLANLKKEKCSILNDIYEIELRYEKGRIENNKLRYQLRRVQSQINIKELAKKKLETEIEKSKKNVKKILRTLFKIPSNLYIILFIQVDRSDQLYQNYGLFKALVEYQAGEINKIKVKIDQLNLVKNELQVQYDRLAKLTRDKEQKLRHISGLKQQKLSFIKRINNDRKDYDQLLGELQNEAEKLTAILENKEFISRYVSLNLKKIRGQLIWPIKGKVISTFGRKKSTKFDTYIFNNGIEIQPSATHKIKAVYDGDVVFSDYFKGYGNLIILQHSKHFLTLYGHCESFLKKKGERVKRGEDIAIVGSTGSTSGKSLYFEIRQKLKAQNPLKWLQKR